MGNKESVPETQIHLPMETGSIYPDMNAADDMHRMTNYIMDLRNMTFAISILTFFGIFILLLIKYIQCKQSSKHRLRCIQNFDSAQSSINRKIAINNENGFYNYGMNSSRHSYHKKSKYLNSSRHLPIDMEKLIESQNSNNTAVNNQQKTSLQQTNSIVNNPDGNSTLASISSTRTSATINDFSNETNENVNSVPSRKYNSSIPLPIHSSSLSSSTYVVATTPTTKTPSLLPIHQISENNHLKRSNENNSHLNYRNKRLVSPVKLLINEIPNVDI